jgi:copper chaperone
MKYIIALSSIALFTFLLSCSSEPEQIIPVEQITFSIQGMHCDGCAKSVEVELRKIDGVSDVSVSFDDSSATFSVAQNKIPTNQELAELMSELGFEAKF